MKKYLLPENGNFYKSNLHCHSTLSDGKKTPSELKELYMKMGYSIIAYTDHDIMVPHNDLTDDKFLALNGFEVEINEETGKEWPYIKTCHICYIALDEDNITQPMWNESYLFMNAPNNKYLVKYDKTEPPYIRKYTGEGVTEMMMTGREKGFFVTYNHPTWSREDYPEYSQYSGMHAFEMFNGGCLAAGYEDYNPRVYDDLLKAGNKIYCIGADDNHNSFDENTRDWDSGIAFTVIKAPDLKYKSITDALTAGNFYSSEGPSIYELWLEDGKIHIRCSEADRIICTYQHRKAGIKYAEGGELITSASFDASSEFGYIRITVIDKSGKHACTNAYYLD